MTDTIVHEPDARRYVLRRDDDLVAVLDYTINGSRISFTRTFTVPFSRGQGMAARVVRFAVDDVEATTALRIVPMCWYVDDWFAANPDRAHLLAR